MNFKLYKKCLLILLVVGVVSGTIISAIWYIKNKDDVIDPKEKEKLYDVQQQISSNPEELIKIASEENATVKIYDKKLEVKILSQSYELTTFYDVDYNIVSCEFVDLRSIAQPKKTVSFIILMSILIPLVSFILIEAIYAWLKDRRNTK